MKDKSSDNKSLDKNQKGNLSQLTTELQYIKGIGPVRAQALAKEGIVTYLDLINYLPRDYIDRNAIANIKALYIKLKQENLYDSQIDIATVNIKSEVTIIAKIIDKKQRVYGKNKKMLEFVLDDGSHRARIIFWNMVDYFAKAYNINENIVVSGKAEIDKYDKISFTHPEIERFDAEDEKYYREGGILPIYKMTQGFRNSKFTMRALRTAITSLISKEIHNVKETLPEYILEKYNIPGKQDAIKNLHFPVSHSLIRTSGLRMKFEEIFYFELFLAIRKQGTKETEYGIKMNPKSKSARELYDSLPFELTNDQKKVIREITDDFKSGIAMNRLLQGDVGSGKTIVALLSMLVTIDNGCQTAIMAPTEILAEQHFHSLSKYLDGSGIKIVQLLGGQRTKIRRKILEEIASGDANIIVGTHAMFESDIVYNRLGFIVIDEQHRFGVAQRAKFKELASKSFENEIVSPHILVMSATPIPRTLSLTLYGDLDVSIIKEMPKNRIPIKTKVVFESQLPIVNEFIREQIQKGFQAYIVYPLVEKSEKLELKAAAEQFERIQAEVFPEFKCGLLHGQMFWYEKEDTMKSFLNKEFQVLVATTVIEVGIDVPNATVMLIENSDRFGLSQLHQLRGRVGRGPQQSYCFLATKDNFMYALRRDSIDENDRKTVIVRLKTMEETSDGFKISEVDLKLRGPGDVLGTRQSGLPNFRFIDLVGDGDIITQARKEAFAVIEDDATLKKPENRILREEFVKLYKVEKNYFDIA